MITIHDKIYMVTKPWPQNSPYEIVTVDISDGWVIYRDKETHEICYEYPESGWDLTGVYTCLLSWVDSGRPIVNQNYSTNLPEWFFSNHEAAEKKMEELNRGDETDGEV